LERSDNPGVNKSNKRKTLKGFDGRRTLSGFNQIFIRIPRVLAKLEPWAEISQRLRRLIVQFICRQASTSATPSAFDRSVCLPAIFNGPRRLRRLIVQFV